MNNAEKLLKTIQEKKITQKPRWRFVLENSVFWGVFFLSLFLGGISFSIIIFSIQNIDFFIVEHLHHSQVQFFLGMIPFFWILFLFLFSLFSYFGFHNTSKGYKFPLFSVIVINIFLSAFFGGILFLSGASERIEHIFARNISFYHGVEERKREHWSHPELGFLSGKILENYSHKTLLVQDFSGKIWEVQYEDAKIRGGISLEKNDTIKLFGEILKEISKSSYPVFLSTEIRPWEGHNMKNKKHHTFLKEKNK